ncbi:zinc finger BED domain-containing protein DAYSLEEPER-like [Chenopodium quinoa]|uniref:zinc finger BED domain-containing protein DAYSLEEPER-like n=1 Tax=Chenopodium quinoa TaxID=63459 RepID=UPI000B788903|nr:zinc finger BED domain-containing protein DAYSLEEPER-like [Chenopodium quinoa]
MKDFDDFSGGEFASTPKSELEVFLEEPLIPRVNELDILDFWKSSQFRFPVLSLMARDILCMPISTVASESAFGIGGRVLDPIRSSLKPSVVEALICLRDWLYGKEANEIVGVEDICDNIMNLKLDIDDTSCPSTTPSPVSASGSGSTPCSTSKPAVNVLD